MPKEAWAGRPPVRPRRQLIDGIRFRVRTGVPWRDMPAKYGPRGRGYDLFRRRQRDGTWQSSCGTSASARLRDLSTTDRMCTVIPASRLPGADARRWARGGRPLRHEERPPGVLRRHPAGRECR
ncbi:transposase, partial [Streptomyces viridosporus]|uniref:transposase n=1 Tax=Streptomyces viridosporus TaxID=67581 RepID=UPI003F658D26